MRFQVTEWQGYDGEIAGTFEDLKDAKKCAEKCVERARKTKGECEKAYVDICPLDDNDDLGDAIETYNYVPVRD